MDENILIYSLGTDGFDSVYSRQRTNVRLGYFRIHTYTFEDHFSVLPRLASPHPFLSKSRVELTEQNYATRLALRLATTLLMDENVLTYSLGTYGFDSVYARQHQMSARDTFESVLTHSKVILSSSMFSS